MVGEEEDGESSRRLEQAPGGVVKNATAGADEDEVIDRVVAGGDEAGEGPRLIQLVRRMHTWRQLGFVGRSRRKCI
jgi:hypothetical protein